MDVRFFDEQTVLLHPAAVLVGSRAVEMDREALKRIAVARAFDPDIFEQHPPFFWPAEISSNRRDAHYTIMRPSSLQNYSAEAEAGVAFMVAHATYRAMPVGGSLTGKYTGPGGNGAAYVRSEFYTVPGLDGGVIPSDQLILGIRTGVYRDVSIGFYGGRIICSIDGLDIFRDWRECPHIPGGEYDVTVDGQKRTVTCVGHVEDAHLSEVSSVYHGSTPGAAVLKAMQESEAGRLAPEMARMIEERYRSLRLDLRNSTRRYFPGHPDEERTDMPDPTRQNGGGATNPDPAPTSPSDPTASAGAATGGGAAAPSEGERGEAGAEIPVEGLAEQLPRVRALLVEAGAPDDGDLLARVRALVERAKDGATYRNDLIERALREGVRAFGVDFDKEAYRATLGALPVDAVKRMIADWERAAKSAVPGGRQTVDGEAPEGDVRGGDGKPAPQPRRGVPRSAFKVRVG